MAKDTNRSRRGFLGGLAALAMAPIAAPLAALFPARSVFETVLDQTPRMHAGAFRGHLFSPVGFSYDRILSVDEMNEVGRFVANKFGTNWTDIRQIEHRPSGGEVIPSHLVEPVKQLLESLE